MNIKDVCIGFCCACIYSFLPDIAVFTMHCDFISTLVALVVIYNLFTIYLQFICHFYLSLFSIVIIIVCYYYLLYLIWWQTASLSERQEMEMGVGEEPLLNPQYVNIIHLYEHNVLFSCNWVINTTHDWWLI